MFKSTYEQMNDFKKKVEIGVSMKKIKSFEKKDVYKILDFVIIIFIGLLSIKKGGFYKTDTLLFTLLIELMAVIYLIVRLVNIKKEKFDFVGFLLLLLPVAYCLPIIFKNYTSLSESIFEMIRYFNLYIIYKLVKNSDNKKMYMYGCISIAAMLCLIGIDGLGGRYLTNILNNFSSGYLSIDLTRMSSTIQYANVLAIFLAISSMFVLDNMNKEKNISKNKYILNSALFFLFTASIVLTMSRMVMIIEIIGILLYLVLNKKLRGYTLLNIVLQAIQVVIYTIFVQGILNTSPNQIYIITFIFIIINILLSLLTYKGINYISEKYKVLIYKFNNRVTKYVALCVVIAVSLIYIIIGLQIQTKILVTSNSKQEVQRNIYNIKKSEENNIKLNITEQEPDSRYRINIFEINTESQMKLIKTFEYYSKTSSEFEFDFMTNQDTKAICIGIDCYKGSISLDSVHINGDNEIFQYLILPSDTIFKVKDIIYGSSSLNDRVDYLKDAFKIWNSSNLNRFIGIGGEGFKNTYETVQSKPYASTEVHNSYIQVLVESGIIGFALLSIAIIVSIKRSNNNIVKIAFAMLLLHSFVDLNFSYMFMIVVFGVLLGLLDEKENNKSIILKNILLKIEILIFGTLLLITLVIVIRANLAYEMKIPVYLEQDLTLEKQIYKVNKLEKRVILDSSEYVYRKELNKEYNTYLNILSNIIDEVKNEEQRKILLEEKENIIFNIKDNADKMLDNNKYSKNVIIQVSNIYFNNLVYFTKLNFSNDIELGYETYLNQILMNLENLQSKYILKDNIKKDLKEVYERYYNELNDKNIKLQSDVIVKYIDTFKIRS